MPEPMTDDDLTAIEARVQLRGTTRAPGIREQLDTLALLAEVHRLQDGIRRKAEAWDRDAPDAEAFRVTADFRTLIGDDDE